MEVFISWSGDRSGKVAEALRDWLPNVIQSVTPLMSASDIDKGSRWSNELAIHLDDAQFGLICLTQENLGAPWLLFEAGALSKSIENSRVVPYLYRVTQAQIEGPLAQFQTALATRDSTLDVIKSINGASGENGLEATRLEKAFETWWPNLENTLNSIPEPAGEAPPSRSNSDILEEVLHLCRQMSRRGVPNIDFEQEALRNFVVHGLHTEPIDSTEDLDTENRQLSSEATRVEATLRRRQRELNMMLQEFERRRRMRRRYPHGPLPSEIEVPSSNDTDKEA